MVNVGMAEKTEMVLVGAESRYRSLALTDVTCCYKSLGISRCSSRRQRIYSLGDTCSSLSWLFHFCSSPRRFPSSSQSELETLGVLSLQLVTTWEENLVSMSHDFSHFFWLACFIIGKRLIPMSKRSHRTSQLDMSRHGWKTRADYLALLLTIFLLSLSKAQHS